LCGQRLLANEPLAKYTAARIGGAAEWLYIARESPETMAEVALTAWHDGLDVRVIGGGANVLVSDHGVHGLVIVNHVSEITFNQWHDGRNVAATSGVSLALLARKCQAHGLSGFEWAVNVPGTVGGAVVNNAGAHGGDMAASLCETVVLDAERGAQLLTKDELHYHYRASSLKARADRRFIVLMAILMLQPDEPAQIQARMDSFVAHRKNTQPPGASLGSVFKNPSGDYAGRLIEAAGLKGYAMGGVMVSPVHANFFVNTASASASAYYALIQHVRNTVAQQFGVILELEIELLGEGFA
jgi:UDP-N-acetylmuramate dehydrogenase